MYCLYLPCNILRLYEWTFSKASFAIIDIYSMTVADVYQLD
jgi:hypothetical protein